VLPDKRWPIALVGLSLALLLARAGAAAAEEKLELHLRLKKGQEYRLRLTVDQHVVQTPPPPSPAGNRPQRQQQRQQPPPQPQAIEQTLAVGYTMSVEDVDAGGAMTLATKYDSVLFRQKGPAGVVEFDSKNPPKQLPPSAKAFAALPGLGFKMTVTSEGAIKSIDGLDDMLAELLRRLDVADGPARANLQKVLTEQFGEAAMKQNMQNLFALYPPRPVAVGESWGRKLVVAKGFPLVIDGTYTLKSRDNGVAEIALDAKVSPNADAGGVDLGTGKMSYELSGTQRGSAKVEEATGWTRSLTTEQDVAGTLRFDTPGDRDAAIPVTMKSRVVLEPADR
jgi:hypothetical protein